MAKEYAQQFYNSTEWKTVRESYKKMKGYTCERCGGLGTEVHHIRHITADNIDIPEVTLNFENMMCLCHQCHMREHRKNNEGRRFTIDAYGHVVSTEKE